MDAWWTNFKTYLAESKNLSDWRSILKSFGKTETEVKSPFEAPESDKNSGNRNSFEFLLSQFLFSRHGSKFKRNFRFDGNLTCNQPAPPIKVNIIITDSPKPWTSENLNSKAPSDGTLLAYLETTA